ncbi:MAG: T9SS type A sorting domain-containing protein [Flavobacteriales bacterium]|nr:T9SS type A sorting domain-containing protein [Flavobacteriales bacterium]
MFTAASFLRPAHLLVALVSLSVRFASAQDPCAQLHVVGLNYGAFGDTVLHVTVHNASEEFIMSYPQFVLVNAEGDTVAREPMTFFVLSPGTSTHVMDRMPDVALPTASFTGTVVLFYHDVDGQHVCSFPIMAQLCPPACAPVNVFVYAEFGSHTTSTFPWTLVDSTGMEVGSGDLYLDLNGWQQDIDSLCLLPGSYTLQVSQPEASGTAFRIGASQDDIAFDGPRAPLAAGGSAELTFTVFPACIAGTQSIPEERAGIVSLAVDGVQATLTHQRGLPLGDITVHDASGRVLQKVHAITSTTTLDLSGLSSGVYLIGMRNAGTTVRLAVP